VYYIIPVSILDRAIAPIHPNPPQPSFIKRAKASAIAVQAHSGKDLKKLEKM
jgi:hypothetical protein